MADSEEDEPSLVDTAPTPGSDGFTVLDAAMGKIEKGVKRISASKAIAGKDLPTPRLEEPGEPSDDKAKVGAFIVKETGTNGNMIFIPDGIRLELSDLQELMEKTWKMKGPNVIVCCDAGTVHPKKFATLPLVSTTKSFEGYWRDAQQHTERALDPAKTGKAAPTQDEMDAFGLAVINDVLFQKLVTIFASILDSSVIQENWLLVDRAGTKSPAADVLIEAAMQATESRPQTIVCDSLKRLKFFRGEIADGPLHPKTQECVAKLKQIKAGAVTFRTDQEPSTVVISQFYDPNDFMFPDTFNDLPLPRPAEVGHIKGRADGKPEERVRWQYHYLQTFFSSGTHYIVLENPSDCPDFSLLGRIGYVVANGQGIMAPRLKTYIGAGESIVMLHNTGGVVQAWASLRKALLSTLPSPSSSELMEKLELKSTDAWIKDFGLAEILMLQELHQRAPMLLRTTCVTVDVMRDTSEDVLSTLTCCFAGGGGVPELGLGDAEQLCTLTCWKRHMILRENADKFERIANNFQVFLYFLGIITTTLAVFYTQEAQARDQQAALAALPTVADAGPNPPVNLSQTTPLGYIMILAPILATFVGTIRAKMRPREKWATCLMASNQIVDQIYRYRLRTDPYDTSKSPPSKEGEEPKVVPPKIREMEARKAFIGTCTQIYSAAISTEVAKNGALKMGKMAKFGNTSTKSKEREQFQLMLKDHVEGTLYGKGIKKMSGLPEGEVGGLETALELMKQGADGKAQLKDAKTQKSVLGKLPLFKKILKQVDTIEAKADQVIGKMGQAIDKANDFADHAVAMVSNAADKAGFTDQASDEEETDDLGAKKKGGMDDYISPISIEAYVQSRVRQYAGYLEKRAPVMARRGLILEHISMLANVSGVVLAFLNFANYVAISVAISSVALAFLDYFYIPSQLSATNKALEDTHNILLYWDSLSLVKRKSRAVKLKIADVMEGSTLQLCSMQTGVSAALLGAAEDTGGGGEE